MVLSMTPRECFRSARKNVSILTEFGEKQTVTISLVVVNNNGPRSPCTTRWEYSLPLVFLSYFALMFSLMNKILIILLFVTDSGCTE